MQSKVQTQECDSAQTSCGSPSTPLPTPQTGWVTTSSSSENSKLAQNIPHMPITPFSHISKTPTPVNLLLIIFCSSVYGRAELGWEIMPYKWLSVGLFFLKPQIKVKGRKGKGHTALRAAAAVTASEIPSQFFDEVLHLKPSEMLACITVTMVELPKTL